MAFTRWYALSDDRSLDFAGKEKRQAMDTKGYQAANDEQVGDSRCSTRQTGEETVAMP